jgi:hypothetical protein
MKNEAEKKKREIYGTEMVEDKKRRKKNAEKSKKEYTDKENRRNKLQTKS